MKARTLARQVQEQLCEAGVPDAAFEAELLVRAAANLTRASFFVDPPLDREAAERAHRMAERRALREPAAYLLGEREFFGLTFEVGPGVLIPRPESELLVELALSEARDMPAPTVVDVGAGSGAIAISIALGLADAACATVVATEISARALTIASRNKARHGARVELLLGGLLDPIAAADVVVANLPYIPTAEIDSLEPEISRWEPRLALDGGRDGLDTISRLVNDCGSRIRPRVLGLEVGAGMAAPVARMVREHGAASEVLKDLSGIDRVVVARWG